MKTGGIEMRTALVSSDFIGRFKDVELAKAKAIELGVKVCHLLYCGNNLQCTFGYALYFGDQILGCDDYTWL